MDDVKSIGKVGALVVLASGLLIVCSCSQEIRGVDSSYKGWFPKAYSGDEFELVGPFLGWYPPYSNYVLCLSAPGDVVWAGTTNGLVRLDRRTETLKRIYYAEDLSADSVRAYKESLEATPAAQAGNIVHQLLKLADLRRSGVLTQDEFEKLKRKLLSGT